MAEIKPKPIPQLSQEQIEKFWASVRKPGPDECWPWLRGRDKDGYGLLTFRTADTAEKTYRTHRLAYSLAFGDPGDVLVLHHCDNPPCCNPAHLFKGDNITNKRDMIQKGRDRSRGERNPNRKLSASDVQEIRKLFSVMTVPAIARKVGMHRSTIRRIKIGQFWKTA